MHIGYAAMLERFSPAEILRDAASAQAHGFAGVMATDHFQPWLPRHHASAHFWTMLGALSPQVKGDLGGVTTPTYRAHPAVVAQAMATAATLAPGRSWFGIGSGEALNEHVTGDYWPEAPERISRMFEALEIIRKLFTASAAGRDVRHRGEHFRMETTRLWTMPDIAPELYVATTGPQTARRAGRVADGIITGGGSNDRLAPVLQRFAEGAREAGRDAGALHRVAHVNLAWAPTQQQAEADALREWPIAGLRFRQSDIRSPFEFEQLARTVRLEDIAGVITVSSDPDVHRAELQRYLDLGFDRIYVHNVCMPQQEWIEVFGREVIPRLHR